MKRSSADEVLERRNPTKNASVRNRYNAVRLNFAGGYAVEFRLFDDGAAYRFVTSLPGEVEVMGEACRLGFPAGSEAWFPRWTVSGRCTRSLIPVWRRRNTIRRTA